MTDTVTKSETKPAKLGAEKLTLKEQKRRYTEAAPAARAYDDEAVFNANLERIAKSPAVK